MQERGGRGGTGGQNNLVTECATQAEPCRMTKCRFKEVKCIPCREQQELEYSIGKSRACSGISPASWLAGTYSTAKAGVRFGEFQILGSRVRNVFSNQSRSFIYDMPRSVNFRVLSDGVG